MLLSKMCLFNLYIAIEFVKSFDTFSQTYHNVEHKIPILMPEIDRHLLFNLFWIILYLLINKI